MYYRSVRSVVRSFVLTHLLCFLKLTLRHQHCVKGSVLTSRRGGSSPSSDPLKDAFRAFSKCEGVVIPHLTHWKENFHAFKSAGHAHTQLSFVVSMGRGWGGVVIDFASC